jgi:hypothetical protein
MKKISLVFFIFVNLVCFTQNWNNLVPNYSFEINDKWSPLTGSNGWNDPCYNVSWGPCDDYDNIVEYWSHINEWTHPLYGCLFKGFVPTADVKRYGYIEQGATYPQTVKPPRSNGEYYGYTNGEYLIVPIEGCFNGSSNCLSMNKTYYIEFYFDGVGDIKVWLSDTQPTYCNVNNNAVLGDQIINVIPNQENYANPNEFYKWKKYSGYFKPNENNYKWITFGKSGNWDDIKIYEVDDNLCRNEWYFDNTVFNYPLEIFQAGDFIKAGTGVDPEAGQLDGPVTVLAGSHTIFTAGHSIYLEPGFEVQQGAIFETDTVPCRDLCPPLNQNLPDINCVSQPTHIGNSAFENTLIEAVWQPSSYLDNPYSVNPIFTPPAGNGSIIYSVVYHSSQCPNSLSLNAINVTYTDQPNVSPTISATNINYDNYILTATVNVNSAVNEVLLSFVNADGQNVTITYTRGVDFTNNSFNITLNTATDNISCCQNVTINLLATSICGQSDNTSINWQKANNFGFIGDLPNTFTPDGDGLNDYYCFYANACSYKFSVTDQWGNLLYEEEDRVDSDQICLDWQGQIPTVWPFSMFIDSTYVLDGHAVWTVFDIYDDCGNHDGRLRSLWVYGAGNIIINPENPTIINATQQNGFLNINTESAETYNLYIANSLGQIVYNYSFSSRFNMQLPNGIYYITVINQNQEIELKKKIVIVN